MQIPHAALFPNLRLVVGAASLFLGIIPIFDAEAPVVLTIR